MVLPRHRRRQDHGTQAVVPPSKLLSRRIALTALAWPFKDHPASPYNAQHANPCQENSICRNVPNALVAAWRP